MRRSNEPRREPAVAEVQFLCGMHLVKRRVLTIYEDIDTYPYEMRVMIHGQLYQVREPVRIPYLPGRHTYHVEVDALPPSLINRRRTIRKIMVRADGRLKPLIVLGEHDGEGGLALPLLMRPRLELVELQFTSTSGDVGRLGRFHGALESGKLYEADLTVRALWRASEQVLMVNVVNRDGQRVLGPEFFEMMDPVLH